MINFRLILTVLGILLVLMGTVMLLPATADLWVGNSNWQAFLASSATLVFLGGGLYLSNRGGDHTFDRRQAFILTATAWIVLPAAAALPLMFGTFNMSFTDAFFETMSGMTTTGATILSGLDKAPPGVLLWRSLLGWLGGIGIIVMAISILPLLRVGGMQLFRTEASAASSEKALPRVADIVKAIGYIYLTLTFACVLALWTAGMSLFDAINHAMTTLSTCGFSTSDGSIGHFDSPLMESILVIFMIMGATPFLMYLHFVRGKPGRFLMDSQIRWFLSLILTAIALMVWWQVRHNDTSFWEALRHATFSVTSVMTGTGYITKDYSVWGGFGMAGFFFLMFIGGCAGSASGGIKVFRIQVVVETLRCRLMQLIRPNGIFIPRYNGRALPEEAITSVISFIFLFFSLFGLIAIGLSLTGLDFVTAISSAGTAISNVGPGLGNIGGPSGNFQSISDPAKWMMSLAMLLGRLELFTVLVLFSRRFWLR